MSEIQRKEKESFLDTFASLRPDLFLPDTFTDEQRSEVLEQTRPQKTRTAMFSSIPMQCKGPKCSYADTCPLQQKGIAPIGYKCPLEMGMVQQFMYEYMEELRVDPNNLIEVSMIRDLVDQEIQYLRKTKILAKEHFIQENIAGFTSDGEAIFKKELHIAVELEDRLHRRRRDLRNQLMATREARAKIGQGNLDTAQVLADVFEKVAEIKHAQEKLVRQKLGLEDVDDYIEAMIVDPPELEE